MTGLRPAGIGRLLLLQLLPLVTLVACSGGARSSRPDTVTTATGLRYVDLQRGTGAPVVAGQTASIDYAGYFADGKLFDTSIDTVARANAYDRGGAPFTPIEVLVGSGEVIKGWDEALTTDMRVGGSRRLIIPPALAYGEKGRNGIPPNSTLYFDIHVLAARWDTVTTMSGLRYVERKHGRGKKVESGMKVRVDYAGYLTDGTLFDTSLDSVGRMHNFDRGGYPFQPLEFVVGQGKVIRGWDEGLTTDMRVGGRRRLIIPPELAYGQHGSGSIPPNSTLIFDIEVLSAE